MIASSDVNDVNGLVFVNVPLVAFRWALTRRESLKRRFVRQIRWAQDRDKGVGESA